MYVSDQGISEKPEHRVPYRKIWNIHSQSCVKPESRIQCRQIRPRKVVSSRSRVECEKSFGRRNLNECPDKQSKPRGWDDKRFCEEQPPDLVRRDEHEWELNRPIDKVAHHSYSIAEF